VWDETIDGRRLELHLSGINNQNFVMTDEQTGSWWQQATGEAFFGPLRGRRLRPVFADEVSFAMWRREHPQGRVMRPASDPTWRAWSADWEVKTARLPLVRGAPGADGRGPLPPRTVVMGLARGSVERAYPLEVLRRRNPVMDDLGGTGVVILVGEDGRSVRVFESSLDGREVPFFVKLGAPAAAARRWIDGASGSEWDFQGRAVAGPWRGRQLRPLPAAKDYWFDWWTYHPRTSVYTGGSGAG
jgi:hypothetical protein